MVLSDEKVKEFQELYKKRFGKEISKEYAYENGIKLLQLMSIIYRPMTKDQQKEVLARQSILLKK